ncbi:MAG: hypothetical protein D9V45_12910 [Chloroflexi bacterium]|nr:MAG: hypothetical protein D9V45_12910 [Chloroflexota bacterium]
MSMLNINTRTNSDMPAYHKALLEIRAAQAELKKYESIMTPYERHTINESIQSKVAANRDLVYNGVKGAWLNFISGYKDAVKRYLQAEQNEINSWDSGKLGTEMHTFQMRLNQAIGMEDKGALAGNTQNINQVKAMYQEAMNSGDRYKQRAAAEVIRGVNTKNMQRDQVVEIRLMARNAEEQLKTLRTSDALQKAAAEANQAQKELFEQREGIKAVAETMGEPVDQVFQAGDYAKLTKMLQVDSGTREVKLYGLDAPEVTGISFAADFDHDLVVGGNNG